MGTGRLSPDRDTWHAACTTVPLESIPVIFRLLAALRYEGIRSIRVSRRALRGQWADLRADLLPLPGERTWGPLW